MLKCMRLQLLLEKERAYYENTCNYIMSKWNCSYIYGSRKLEQAAKDMGVDIKVETQGGVGAENVLTSKEIKEADGIIIAADRQVDLSRFNGKPLINESVREGIHRPKELIQRVIDTNLP